MTDLERDPLWYKHAVIYEVSVRSFADSNGDGVGDLPGLASKLDYLQALGVNCLWLLPFYPSPMRDGGYDISDYTSIHPVFGTMRDFKRLVREAHRRGIRIITELVVNHTSDQHPWFQAARRAPKGSAIRNMYVWSDSDERYSGTRIIFTDTETSNWAWDQVAGQYYWHRFFSHQPDLNYDSPRVRRAVQNLMKFWFDLGVDGLRLDAIPYLVERDGTNCENLPETHAVVKEWRRFVDEHFEDRVLLAEANQWPTDVRAYFGDGDECHMAYHFPVMPRIFMSLRQEDRHPIVDILAQTPDIPPTCQWCLFLRNHDELTLEMVTDEERDYMYSTYAADPQMRVNVGVRRRLAPLLGNNRRAIELLHSLLFSLPGTPVLYYGDEIGMGDNYWLGDRDGVRTPMQWSPDRNAGFSQADAARLYAPLIQDPVYGYQSVNVEAQERSPSSLLNWMRRIIALRNQHPVFGLGTLEMLHPSNRSILAFVRRYDDDVVLVVANLSRFVQPAELDLSEYAGMTPVELIGRGSFPPIGDTPYFLSLGPHTFFWFELRPQPVGPVVASGPAGPHARSIKIDGDWNALFEGEPLAALEREVLPAFLTAQRWFGGKDRQLESVRVADVVPLVPEQPSWLALLEVAYAGGHRENYTLPLAMAVGRAGGRALQSNPAAVLAPVEGASRRGVLLDALATDDACLALLDAIGERRTLRGRKGTLRFTNTPAFREMYEALDPQPAVERSSGEQSNTSLRIGGELMLKLLRRVEPGPHPEIEVGTHLGRVGFTRAPRLAGHAEYSDGGEGAAVAVLQELVWNQGDGWTHALGELERYLEEGLEEPDAGVPLGPNDPGSLEPAYVEAAHTLGLRTGELHRALAAPGGLEEFAPEQLTRADVDAVVQRIAGRLQAMTPALQRLHEELPPDAVEQIDRILQHSRGVRTRLRAPVADHAGSIKIRVHGDYHLGQVLWARNDFIILDFEGEVGLPLPERRQKMSPLTDVAGMIRSFQYAAEVGSREYATRMPDAISTIARLRAQVMHWEERCIQSFLAGYTQAVADAGFLPEDPDRLRRWLDLHLLDKAVHELEYELGHRPDWVTVPMRAVADLLAALQ